MKNRTRHVMGILIVIGLFFLASYLVQQYLPLIQRTLDIGFWGMVVYMSIVIIAIVFAPVSSIPLIPVAVGLWGPFLTAVLNIISWTIGSCIAFVIARTVGVSVLKNLVDLDSLYRLQKHIPQQNLFWSVVCMRMIIPVDILSYALGLLTRMKFMPFLFATFIGVIPFAFIFSYMSAAVWYYQLIVFVLVFMLVVIGYVWWEFSQKKTVS